MVFSIEAVDQIASNSCDIRSLSEGCAQHLGELARNVAFDGTRYATRALMDADYCPEIEGSLMGSVVRRVGRHEGARWARSAASDGSLNLNGALFLTTEVLAPIEERFERDEGTSTNRQSLLWHYRTGILCGAGETLVSSGGTGMALARASHSWATTPGVGLGALWEALETAACRISRSGDHGLLDDALPYDIKAWLIDHRTLYGYLDQEHRRTSRPGPEGGRRRKHLVSQFRTDPTDAARYLLWMLSGWIPDSIVLESSGYPSHDSPSSYGPIDV